MAAHKNKRLSPLAQPYVTSKLPSTLWDSEKVMEFNPLAEPFTPTEPLSPRQFANWGEYPDAADQSYPPAPTFNNYNFEPYTSENLPWTMSVPTKFVPNISAAEFDLRDSPLNYRKSLSKGKHAFICAGNTSVAKLPQALFLAASTKPELLVNSVVQLPAYADPRGVALLCKYLTHMIHWRRTKYGYRMSTHMEIYDMLSVTAAAALLGMDQYVGHIYRKCEAQLHNDLLSYEDLDAITYFAQQHHRLMRIVARKNLAPRMRAGNIPDPEHFAYYLSQNVILGHEIYLAHVEHSADLYNEQSRLEHRQARIDRFIQAQASHGRTQAWPWPEDRNQWDVERDKHELERLMWEEEREKHEREKAAETKAFWAKKKAEDAEDEQSIQKKVKLAVEKRKFTNRERLHWSKTRGTKLPKGC
jgi:hypothetical protein